MEAAAVGGFQSVEALSPQEGQPGLAADPHLLFAARDDVVRSDGEPLFGRKSSNGAALYHGDPVAVRQPDPIRAVRVGEAGGPIGMVLKHLRKLPDAVPE